jgi:predicted transcriptional regulator
MKISNKNIQVKTLSLSQKEVYSAIKTFIEDQRNDDDQNNICVLLSDDYEVKIFEDHTAEVITYYPERNK